MYFNINILENFLFLKIKLNKPQKHVKNDMNFIPEINEEDSEINENIDEYSYLINI